jgi:hypothetical protein
MVGIVTTVKITIVILRVVIKPPAIMVVAPPDAE